MTDTSRIEEWLEVAKISQAAFARQIGVAPASVSRWVNRERAPRWELIQKMHTVTKGFVTANDFMPSAEPAKVEKADA